MLSFYSDFSAFNFDIFVFLLYYIASISGFPLFPSVWLLLHLFANFKYIPFCQQDFIIKT